MCNWLTSLLRGFSEFHSLEDGQLRQAVPGWFQIHQASPKYRPIGPKSWQKYIPSKKKTPTNVFLNSFCLGPTKIILKKSHFRTEFRWKWFQPLSVAHIPSWGFILKTFGWLRSKLLGKDLRPLLFGDVPGMTEDELQQEPGLDDKGCWCVGWGNMGCWGHDLRWDSW